MKKLITIFMTLVLSLAVFSFVGCKGQDVAINKVACLMSDELQTTENYVQKTLTAVILPANASNKTVSFSVAWGEGAERSSEDVSDYIVVVPDEINRLVGYVRCYQPFGDDEIIITATTINGLTSTCTVSFVGELESMDIQGNSEFYHDGVYFLECGWDYDYDFEIDLQSFFGDTDYADLSYSVSFDSFLNEEDDYWRLYDSNLNLVDGRCSFFFITDFEQEWDSDRELYTYKVKKTAWKTPESYYNKVFEDISLTNDSFSFTLARDLVSDDFSGVYIPFNYLCNILEDVDFEDIDYSFLGIFDWRDSFFKDCERNRIVADNIIFNFTITDSYSGLSKTISIHPQVSIQSMAVDSNMQF